MPTRQVVLPGSRTGRRTPIDAGYVHWCSESCLHLDPTDRQIVVHIMHGKTNQQIGESICLTERTITNRVSAIMLKLGVHNRAELAVVAVKTGIE